MKLDPVEVTPNGVSHRPVHSTGDSLHTARQDFVAQEVPVALVFNGISHAVMMASPCDLEDFALGFGLTEGLLASPEELYDVEERQVPEGIELHLQVSAECAWRLRERRRTLAGRTGCGLCGTDSLGQVRRELASVQTVQLTADAVIRAEQQLRDWQHMQQLTGATHAAAWVCLEGEILRVREDVGRHNALDKLVGSLTRSKVNASAGFFCITSRASFEMVQKAVAFGAGVLAAVSAPTALAIDLANSSNLALAGYVRNNRLVAYSFPERFRRDGTAFKT
ncbi:formate dehydrogenase accessory sulfurtransferase FdhD [Aquabacterium sp.]|uniref:formate dehydrogenase accessory sulfurtransferase FdhD n=1 Tax=Aquabacterium sp. TaxID=1872578 RepID=UPI003BAEF13D